jgi:GMP synthase-like glutamine amidotransferase
LEVPETRTSHLAFHLEVKLRLEEITGMPCLSQRYSAVNRQQLRELGVRAIVLSGAAVDFWEYHDGAFDELKEIIREARWPILGFCAGHQLIALAHGAEVAPMRRLEPWETDVTELSAPGYLKEWGFTAVDVLRPDPILEGLGNPPTFLEVHYCEVKQVPPGFAVLASTDDCPIQMIKQVGKPVYGTQFHPEAYTEWPHDQRNTLVTLVNPNGHEKAQPDGKRLIENFFRVAGVIA